MEYNYSDLGLKTNNDIVTFKFKDKEIEIFKYLPLEYKYDVIMTSLHDSDEAGVYNYLKLDAYFNLNMFLAFVKNINFTQEEMNDKLKLYNEIYSSGLLESFLAAVDEKEYNDCYTVLDKMVEIIMKYNTSSTSLLRTLIEDLPKRSNEVKDIIENIDDTKIEQIKNIASIMTSTDKNAIK